MTEETTSRVVVTPDYEGEVDPRGVGWVYFENMLKNKERLAQVDGLTGEEETFGDLLQRCVRVAIGLQQLGVEYGDMISVCCYNHLSSCVPHIAALFVGAKISALDPSLSLSDTIYIFQIIMPKVIFVGEESVSLIKNVIKVVGCKTTIIVFGHTEKHLQFTNFAKRLEWELEFKPVIVKNIKDVALVLLSSGTSGLPKGICHSHYSILCPATAALNYGATATLCLDPFSPYWNIFFLYLNHSILHGTARVVYPKFDLNNPWKVFSRKVTMACFSPTEFITLCMTPKPKTVDLSTLQLVIAAGGSVNQTHILKAKTLFINAVVRIGYGQSEVFSAIFMFNPKNPQHLQFLELKPNSCGLPTRGISYKVVDLETGVALGPHEKGELRVKTKAQMSGYYNTDSSEAWDEDGWLKTGDYVYYDEDFCFFIVDRTKEMFKYQCWHIQPAVLEAILLTHPAVYKAVVIGIPHEIDEFHPMAVVQLNKEAKASEEEIRNYLDERVENRQKLRGGVKFVGDFPMTPSRKINRWALKQLVYQNKI